jgi:hypothetical protein
MNKTRTQDHKLTSAARSVSQDAGRATLLCGENEMTEETEDQPETKMSDETKATIVTWRQMVATVEENGVLVLFATPTLETFGRLLASDDYFSNDGWPAIKAIEDEVADLFKAREADLKMDWLPMLLCWHTLSREAYRAKTGVGGG